MTPGHPHDPPHDSWREIAPGVYDDGAGGMHIDVPAMLRGNGWPDTPANRDAIEQAARDMFDGGDVEFDA